MHQRRRAAAATLVLGDASALELLRPHPVRLAHHVAAGNAWIERTGTDHAVAELAATALWLVAVWVGVGLVAATAARLPGVLGAVGRGVSRVLLPRVLRQLVAGSAGLGILLVPVAAGAQQAPAAAHARPVAAAPTMPGPSWPVTPSQGGTSAAPTAPAPRWPSSPTSDPAPTAPRTTPTPAPPRAVTTEVRVRADDSLWLLAARRLGPGATDAQIAREWPRWYAANRDVIGDDPSLITTGQVLHAPAPSTQETR